jgi:hypothetical protein
LIYNSDADNMFIYVAPPMRREDVHTYVDEVADAGASTLFMCPNLGMPLTFPTRTGEMFAAEVTDEQRRQIAETAAVKSASLERAAANLHGLIDSGHDPVGLVLERARARGLETFITFRLNECHCVDTPDEFPLSLIVSRFWRTHPQWRIGKPGDPLTPLYSEILGPSTSPVVAGWLPGGLNFAVREVRAHVLAQLRECCERYDIDGLDLDFQRFPMYFPPGEETRHVPTMTAWIGEVRAMTRQVGQARGRPLLLSMRVLARPAQNKGVGLDPVGWARDGLLDMMVASHYLRNDFPLPIGEYRQLLPDNVPLYGSIEVEPTAADYRRVARQLWSDGVDGIMMFNFFTCREGGKEPEFALLRELGDPDLLNGTSRP